jgi:hypothetical protein
MICDQQQWTVVRSGLDVLETVNVHDVVSGKMDPAGAKRALTPRPESLPGALIHAPDETESESFERC